MQGLAADVPEVGIVEKVPGKGMADIFHMDTDLVGASCLKTETQERQIRVFIIQKPFIPGGRGLSVVRVRDPLDGRALLPPMGTETVPQASVFPQTAARYSRQISRRSTWPERREELSPFFATRRRPDVSLSRRLSARNTKASCFFLK